MNRIDGDESECCGCQSCMLSCPTNAIHMEIDEKGFSYPVINEEKCIDCGKCKKRCPLRNDIKQIDGQKVYALKNKNDKIRKNSSSGGFFFELAKRTIKENGIVYGAVYNEKLDVIHSKVDNVDELYKLQTSKYVQSDINLCYKEIEENLNDKKLILFSGTPCQVFGLNKFLGKNYDNLITCDFVCHGVPSPKIFEDYKKSKEKKYKAKILSVNFRHKNENETQNIKIVFDNNKKYINSSKKDEYYFLFSKNYSLRDCCYKCKFANMDRVSDITMGDYWGISKYFKDFDDGNGVSLLIINTAKGLKIFNELQDKFYKEESNIKKCIQPSLLGPTTRPNNYDAFWKLYNKFGYNMAVTVTKRLHFISRVKNKIIKMIDKGEK